MRSKTAIWFECKIKYEKMQEDSTQKKVTEQYVVDAMSFAEAEARITEQMSQYISGEFTVESVKKASYAEVFFMSDGAKKFINEVEEMSKAIIKGDKDKAEEVFHRPLEGQNNLDSRWYKAKLQFITTDEKTEKEKRQNVTYLVEACSLHNALDNIDSVMRGTMIDYVQANVGETQILEVFEYTATKGAALLEKMYGDLQDQSLTVEAIADRYVSTATPELRQQLIGKLKEKRKEMFGIE